LRRAALLHDAGDLTDGQLLARFLARREEAAFEVLVRRHGPMVQGVCRRVLSNAHDAEDAFQATFLVLIRKGTSLLPRQTLGNWLYGVAFHTALKARAASWKRRAKERHAAAMTRPEAAAEDAMHDLLPLLDRELERLPDKYREAVVLCELEGKSRQEAAQQLGVPTGTLSGRLTTARRLLARRLRRRGVTLSGAALASMLTPSVTSACVPPTLVASVVKSAAALAAGQAAAGAASTEVVTLMQAMLKSMLLAKLKLTTTVLLIAAVVSGSAGAFAYRVAGQEVAPQEVHRSSLQLDARDAERPIVDLSQEPPRERAQMRDDKADTIPADKNRLQGEWLPVKAFVNGRPADPNSKKIRTSALTINDDEAAFWDAKGTYTLNPDRKPRQLVIVLNVKGKKETIKAIYEFHDDQLLLSWIDSRECPPDFDTGMRNGVSILYARKGTAKP
jgi:RNA polymerase sigma-70 factor (ECF subfamily)